MAHEIHGPAFLALNPNGKIPAIYGPGAERHATRAIRIGVMWQMGGVGPLSGQVGFFNKFAGNAYEDKRPRDRYTTESARLLGVLDERLTGRDWVMGADYSIADLAARLSA
jgi:GST-like protein